MLVDCVTNVPLYVLTTRMFEKANHMMDVPWGYIYGATIVRKETWEKIPAGLRPQLQAISVELGQKVDAEVKRLVVSKVANFSLDLPDGAVNADVDANSHRPLSISGITESCNTSVYMAKGGMSGCSPKAASTETIRSGAW